MYALLRWHPAPAARLAALLLLALFFALPASAKDSVPGANPMPVTLPGVPNAYKVAEGVYRSAQPTAEGMRNLESFGIHTVINLRDNHTDDDEAKGTALTLVCIPLSTRKTGTDEQALTILAAIRKAKKPVLIHCMHGADRTGFSVAMYRMVEQGWSAQDAIREMKEGGFGFHAIWQNIPRYLQQADAAYLRRELDKRAPLPGSDPAGAPAETP